MRWLRMGASHARKTKRVIRGLGSWRLSSIMWPMIQSAMPMQWNPNKNARHQNSSELPWLTTVCVYCYTSMCWEGDASWPHRKKTEKFHVWYLPRPHLTCLFFWPVLISISFCCCCYNETVIVSIALSSVFWVILANYWIKRTVGTPVASWSEMGGGVLRTPSLRMVSEVRAIFWGNWALNLQG